jgi:branched-chain amino acid transport system permease protein
MSMTAEYVVTQAINGLVIGSVYALLALGMNTAYGMLKLINFAHGAVVMVGAYVFLLAMANVGAAPVALVAAAASGVILGFLLDSAAYRPLRGRPEVALLISSLGAYIFMENIVRVLLTSQPRPFTVIRELNVLFNVYGITIRVVDILAIVSGVTISAAFVVYSRKAKSGIAMKATAESLPAAGLIGVNVNRIIVLALILGSVVAGYTGFVWGVKYGQIEPGMGFLIGVKAFVAIVVGGIGSIPGAVLGGYVIGLAEMLTVGLLPPVYGGYRDGVVFLILIIVLLIRPYGILGQKEEVRV